MRFSSSCRASPHVLSLDQILKRAFLASGTSRVGEFLAFVDAAWKMEPLSSCNGVVTSVPLVLRRVVPLLSTAAPSPPALVALAEKEPALPWSCGSPVFSFREQFSRDTVVGEAVPPPQRDTHPAIPARPQEIQEKFCLPLEKGGCGTVSAFPALKIAKNVCKNAPRALSINKIK